MQTDIIRVGNSKGIRLPKAILQQLGIDKSVSLEVKDGVLVVRPLGTMRQGWREAARAAVEAGHEERLMPDLQNDFDRDDWQW
jgi:antitoxin MazE